MPLAPPRPCTHPGCHELTTNGRCAKHRRWTQREYDRSRPSAAKRGYDYEWQMFEADYLDRHRVCESIHGCTARASHAHHVQKLSEGGAKYDEANLQALCDSHHNRLKGAGGRG